MLTASRNLSRAELAAANRALKGVGVRLERPRGAYAKALRLLEEGRVIPVLKMLARDGQQGHRAMVEGDSGGIYYVWVPLAGRAACTCSFGDERASGRCCSHVTAARMAMGYRAKKEKTEKAEPGCTEPACPDCPSECEGSEG